MGQDVLGLAVTAVVAGAGMVAYKLLTRLRWHKEQLAARTGTEFCFPRAGTHSQLQYHIPLQESVHLRRRVFAVLSLKGARRHTCQPRVAPAVHPAHHEWGWQGRPIVHCLTLASLHRSGASEHKNGASEHQVGAILPLWLWPVWLCDICVTTWHSGERRTVLGVADQCWRQGCRI